MTTIAEPESWPRRWLARAVDLRPGEASGVVLAFVLLLLIITAHTILETARDALLLTRLPAKSIAAVYVAVAVCVLPAAAAASRLTARVGVRRALVVCLGVAAAALVALFAVHSSPASVIALYVMSGLIGAVVVPQFWSLVGSIWTVAQARRLLATVAAAGVIGGTLGSGAAALLLSVMRVKALLLVSAGVLLAAAATVIVARRGGARPAVAPDLPMRETQDALRREPFLVRIALLVVASTATALVIDYFFKSAVARNVPREHVATFVARYYAGLNVLSLVTQVVLSGALVRRMGLATAIIVTPFWLVLGAGGALAAGGALLTVVLLRGIDGALLNSIHRVTTELIYLPVPAGARARAKPFIDGALARTTQAVCGLVLLVLAANLSPRAMAAIACALAVIWLVVAATTRRPYLGLLRRAIPTARAAPSLAPIDLESAASLVQLLAHEDPATAVGAMTALERRGRGDLVSALILLHEDDAVLVRALASFGASTRQDWVPRARRLLSHDRVEVRMAAARALASHGGLTLDALASDSRPRVAGYVALTARAADKQVDPMGVPAIAEMVDREGPDGDEARLGLLAALADAAPHRRYVTLLLTLAEGAGPSSEWSEALARAATAQRAVVLVPDLIERLRLTEGRDAIGGALASLGPQAFDAVVHRLVDPDHDRRIRIHLPQALARFGTRRAAETLLQRIEVERDGLVRYRCIRALQRVVTAHGYMLDRKRVEQLARGNLVEHFRLTAMRAPFDEALLDPTGRLLARLLDDKMKQSLERAFRLLQIAHPREDLRRVELASRSLDRRVRANALEFLDTLLGRREERPLSAMLRAAAEDLPPAQRVAAVASFLAAPPPHTAQAALDTLVDDGDATVRALAELHRAKLAGRATRVAIAAGAGTRSPIELETEPVAAGAAGG